MEIDISDKAHAFIKYGFVSLLGAACLCAGIVWFYQINHRTLSLVNAQVGGKIVLARTRAAGTITEIFISDGDTVKQGQALAKMKVTVSPEQINQLEANLALSKRNLEEIQAGVVTVQPVVERGEGGREDARVRLERMKRLYEMGAVSAREVDEAEAAYAASASESISYQTVTRPGNPEAIRRAEIQVKQAEAALVAARQDAAATELVAPVDGVVYLTEINVGSKVHPGEAVFRIGDAENLWLEAYVSRDYLDRIYVGQSVSYTLEGKSLHGVITEIREPTGEGGDEVRLPLGTEGTWTYNPDNENVTVLISLPESEAGDVRPAMRTTAKILLD